MKRKTRIVLFTIFMIWLVMFSTDYIRAQEDHDPVFAIHTGSYDDGGSERFTGLFYMVFHVRNLDFEQGNVDYGYHVTFWFTDLDRIKDKVVDSTEE